MTRISGWKRGLSHEAQKRILSWAHKLGIFYYDDDVLPVNRMEETFEP